MAFAERMDSASSGADGLQMHSFGFWQQGLAPGDWSREVIARNLHGEDFSSYRRASDPAHLRGTGSLPPEANNALPEEIVVETARLVAREETDESAAAISRLVASYGQDGALDEVDAEALVSPARSDFYELELVDTVADTARRAGLEGSPMHAAIRGMDAAPAAPEGNLEEETGRFRRVTDQQTDASSVVEGAGFPRFGAASQPLIQSADDFLLL